jgi:putative effector of murein hydrolase LrgA (UPF0299 family)
MLISEASHAFAGARQLPLPGNFVGMLILFALLTSGIAPVLVPFLA